MTKEIIFDMDGTIADLYNYPNWLGHVRAESPFPYRDCKPIYNMDELNKLIQEAKQKGYKISVVTASSKDCRSLYHNIISKEKEEWLQRHGFDYDSFYCIPFGVNKGFYTTEDESILFDDNEEVRADFEAVSAFNKAVDATVDLLEKLHQIIMEK